jgi:NAD(P)-dependent dehydrogenase (short-subunit alcohol dehydrogenase family)
MRTAVITGGSSGLGLAIVRELCGDGWRVINMDVKDIPLIDHWGKADTYHWVECDVSNPIDIIHACDKAQDIAEGIVDCLINNVGVNSIAMLEDFELEEWDRLMNINARSIFLMSQRLLGSLMLAKEQCGHSTIVNIVSNAAHIPMTSSLAYNATKGAAHIMTKQLARELTKRHGITVFGVAPNRLIGTGMSAYIDDAVCKTRGWTPAQAQEYQRQSLLAGEETPPNEVAGLIAYLLSTPKRNRFLTGCVIPYGV